MGEGESKLGQELRRKEVELIQNKAPEEGSDRSELEDEVADPVLNDEDSEKIISDEEIRKVDKEESNFITRLFSSKLSSEIKEVILSKLRDLREKRTNEISEIEIGENEKLKAVASKTKDDLSELNKDPEVNKVYQELEPVFEKMWDIFKVFGWFESYGKGSGDWKIVNEALADKGISEEQIELAQQYSGAENDGKVGPESMTKFGQMLGKEDYKMDFSERTVVSDEMPESYSKKVKGYDSGSSEYSDASSNWEYEQVSYRDGGEMNMSKTDNDFNVENSEGARVSMDLPDFEYNNGNAEVVFENGQSLVMVEPGLLNAESVETLVNLEFQGMIWAGRMPSNGNRPVIVMIPSSVINNLQDQPEANFDAGRYHFHGTHSQMLSGKVPAVDKKMRASYLEDIGKKTPGKNRLKQVALATEELGSKENIYTVYPLSAGIRGNDSGYDINWMKPEEGEHFDGLNSEAQIVVSSILGKKVKVGEIVASGHSAGGKALQNIAESGAKVDRLDYQDASYGSWAYSAYDDLIKYNPNAVMNLFIKRNTKTDNDRTMKLEGKKGVNYVRSNTSHGDMPITYFGFEA